MPVLHIIAGPPGIGKTTNAGIFIDERIFIENSDVAAVALKNQGDEDYQEIAFEQLRVNAEANCKRGIDFGIELNLGYQIPHYSYINHWRNKYSYDLDVTLFFTDSVALCIDRAHQREKYGGHRVAEKIIVDMYVQTLPLLRKNINTITHLQFINVTYNAVELVYFGYYPTGDHEFISPVLPNWVSQNFPELITQF
jgi:predicted ABC-type ATPase